MDKTIPFHAPMRPSDCEVVVLRCHDKIQFDPSVLARAFADKPVSEAENLLCRILENIAEWMDILQQGPGDVCNDPMRKAARRIGLVAGQIGLTDLAISADHVAGCVQSGDQIALAATIGRLERAFDRAVTEVWNCREV